jgi:hypothetical protein
MARRPIIEAAIDRVRENRPIVAAVVEGLRNAAANPNTALTPQDVPAVAAAVEDAIARDPVVQNATNQEPWWQSRIKIGTLILAVTMVARWFGYELPAVSEADMDIIYNVLATFGGGVVGIGRWVSNLKPVNWRRPWTLLGIGR